jgi:Retrotransposon gag protein
MVLNGENDLNRPLRDFIIPKATNMRPSVVAPAIAANNFELKANLITMAQQNQFSGLPSDDPHLYLTVFLKNCDTYKSNGVSDDVLRLRLFLFSLRDRARAWMHSLPAGSITTWDHLTKAFLTKYFPPSKTAQLRGQIVNFEQKGNESLYDAWERFKDLLRLCPHHGLAK